MSRKHPLASLSLDLDDKWTYLKTYGDKSWSTYPSYLSIVVPRILDVLDQRDLKITFFVVGQDAGFEKNTDLLRSIADAGHEIANHSLRHEPWMHTYGSDRIGQELSEAAAAIESATGQRPRGFRGPGYSLSDSVLNELIRQDYVYDASSFPNFILPIANLFYFRSARLDEEEMRRRKAVGGKLTDAFRTLKAHRWQGQAGAILEIPVTTMPLAKLPMHFSHVIFAAMRARKLATLYFRQALGLCRLFNVQPSLLLHPTDFLGSEDTEMAFFPGMRAGREFKLSVLGDLLDILQERFSIRTMMEHAQLHLGQSPAQIELAPHQA